MFYSEAILAKKGPLAKVWLAAHWEKKLSKAQFLQTNIEKTVNAIVDQGHGPMALRLTGQLLLGIVRIYSRQARYLLDDCNEALLKIKLAFSPANVDLTADQRTNKHLVAQFTLSESLTKFDLLNNDLAFDLNKDFEFTQAPSIGTSQNIFDNNMFDAFEPLEVARSEKPAANILTQNIQDEGIDLGIDIDDDIEIGRRAEPQSAFNDRIQSPASVDLNLTPLKEGSEGIIGPDSGFQSPELPNFGNDDMLDLLTGREDSEVQEQQTEQISTRYPRKGTAQLDSIIELTGQQVKQQLKDVSAITKKHEILPQNPEALSLLNREKYLSNVFSQLDNCFLAHVLTDDCTLLTSSRKRNKSGNVTSPVKRAKSTEQDDMPMFDEGFNFGEEEIFSKTLEDGIVLDGHQDMNADETEDIISAEKFPTIETLRQSLSEDDHSAKIGFSELTSGLKRAQTAQAFYETLLLATKNAIEVKQRTSFGDIEIKALPLLYSM